MKTLSIEREKYHEFIEKLKGYLKPGALIYDIGKSSRFDYSPVFSGFKYETMDRNESLNPDHSVDLEEMHATCLMPCPDAVLCNGVSEQCGDFYKVMENITLMLKEGGYALFGIMSVGYPIYDTDFTRFTPRGVDALLKDYKILEEEIIYNGSFPSYVFAICKKRAGGGET